MVVKDKNVLVFGSGISGEAACELLLKEEAKVVLYDGNDKLNPEEIRAKIEGGDSESLEIVLGTLEGDRKEELLDKLSLVVIFIWLTSPVAAHLIGKIEILTAGENYKNRRDIK